ncbi:MAG: SIS domain-containing protein [Anaerolineales bacterium]|nr:SIS domain-containing protein [Anaerolineales bacterium]
MGLRDEIWEQPDVLRGVLTSQREVVRRAADAIRARDIRFVLLAARGTSDHAGVYAQYVWGARNGLPVALAAPSLFSIYGSAPRLADALVVGISQSGQSPDVVSVIAEGRRQGALTLAVTNDPASPLATTAEFVLDIHAGAERAVAATKTYTAELFSLAALSAALRGDGDELRALEQVPEAVRQALALEPEVERLAARLSAMSQAVVLGRGFNYANAHEWALKLKELTYVLADPYSAADFQHGPIAIVDPGFPVLVLAPGGAALPDLLGLMRRLTQEYAAELLVFSDADAALALGNGGALRLPAGLPEWLTPLVSIIPAQLFCYHLARAKGLDTEAPRHIRKVTLTK